MSSSYLRASFTKSLATFRLLCKGLEAKDEELEAGLHDGDDKAVQKTVEALENAVRDIETHLKGFDNLEDRWAPILAALPDAGRREEEMVMANYMAAENGPEQARAHGDTLIRSFNKLIVFGKKRIDEIRAAKQPTTQTLPSTQQPTNVSATIPPAQPPTQPPISQSQTVVQQVLPGSQAFSLPKIPLPTFDGNATDFRRFFQAFNQTVHLQNWPDVIKLSYLIDALSGEAARVVEGFDITEENYQPVRDRLAERYGDVNLLKNGLLQRILGLRKPGESYKDALSFVDYMEALIRQAEALNMVTETEAIRLAIERALPAWMESIVFSMKINEPTWDLTTLRRAINKIIKAGAEREAVKPKKQLNEERVTTMPAQASFSKKGPSNFSGKPFSRGKEMIDPSKCCYCQKGPHKPEDCRTIPDNMAREARLREIKACFRCTRLGCGSWMCKEKCTRCSGDHHASFCEKGQRPHAPRENNQRQRSQAPQKINQKKPLATTSGPIVNPDVEAEEVVATVHRKTAATALLTGNLRIHNSDVPKTVSTIVFFDCGANLTYATSKLAEALQLQIGPPKSLMVNTFAGRKEMICRESRLQLVLKDDTKFVLKVLVVDKIVGEMMTATLPRNASLSLERVVIAKREPQLLIGNNYFWELVDKRRRNLLDQHYYVFDSRVGTLLATRTLSLPKERGQSSGSMGYAYPTFTAEEDDNLSNQVARWVEIDELAFKEIHSDDDKLAWDLFMKTTRFKNGRYHVSLPFKDLDAPVPNNRGLALQQLIAWVKKAEKASLEKAEKGFKEWMDEDMIEEVPVSEVAEPRNGRACYHPYHMLSKKARIVHNASAHRRGELSLNGRLYRGPVILPDLVGMLLRFRIWNSVAFGDVKKAFLQLALNDPDKDLLRFVVLRDWSQPCTKDNVVHMRFKRLNFGLICSSFLLAGALKLHFEQEGDDTGTEILRNCYVDNIMTVGNLPEEAINKMEYARSRLAQASMVLRDLVSNDAVQNEIWGFQEEIFPVLGHTWNVKLEMIVFAIKQFNWEGASKRSILSQVASVYDPMGLLSPILLPFRLVIRELWSLDLRWDDLVPKEIVEKLKRLDHRDAPTTIMLPRKTLPLEADELECHIFVDASKVGLGCCVYLKQHEAEHVPNLLFAKSRLAPANCKSIPLLELTAAFIGTRVAKFVSKNVDKTIKKVIIWSDNQSVLWWISGKKLDTLGKYGTQKLNDILSFPAEFRYIPTKLNPADLATRGSSPEGLAANEQWWHGPSFLRYPAEKWPSFDLPPIEIEHPAGNNLEPIEAPVVAVANEMKDKECLIDPGSVLSWVELITKLGEMMKVENDSPGELARKGELQAFRESQLRMPPTRDTIKSLALFRDEQQIWRATSRTLNRSVAGEVDHPIYLPHGDKATELYVLHVHQTKQHSLTEVTLTQTRQTVWIPRGRSFVQKTIKRCKGCQKFRAQPFKLPSLPQLPKERVRAQIPFEYTGVDLTGPFRVKNDEGDVVKVWICLFNCLSTRAIHLELLFNLSAEELVRGIRRFIARRGVPKSFLSDNGTNFRASAPFIKAWQPEEQDVFTKYTLSEKIVWKHIPVLSPWQGGSYERMMRLVKDSLRRAIGSSLLTAEDFRTFVTETEAIVNSRPLTYLNDDDRVLRPIDLLQPNCRVGVPLSVENHEMDLFDENVPSFAQKSIRDSWQRTIDRLNYFWTLFSNDYLLSLQERSRRGLNQPRGAIKRTPRVGEVVLVHDENRRRGEWKCARIVRIIEGDDHQVRSVEIESGNGRRSIRSIALLYPLEGDESVHDTEQSSMTPPDEKRTKQGPQEVPKKVATEDESGIDARYNFRTRQPKNYAFYVLIMVAASLFHQVDSHCLGVLVHQEACVHKGLAIYNNDGVGCAEVIDCGELHLKEFKARTSMKDPCRTPCSCPVWADGCGFEPHTDSFAERYELWIKKMAPDVCWTANEDCPVHQTRRLHKVELFNGLQYIVEQLAIIRRQAERPVCTGRGDIFGSAEYCQRHPCVINGTRFCMLPKHEYAFLQTPDGSVPVRAWATSDMAVFERHPIPKATRPVCLNVTLDCTPDGVDVVGDPDCVDLVEVCVSTGSSKDCTHHEGLPGRVSAKPSADYLVNDHQFGVITWRDGVVFTKDTIPCPAKDVCDVTNCLVCWATYFTPRCALQRVGGTITRAIIVLLSSLSFILILRKLLRHQRRRRLGAPKNLMEMAALLSVIIPAIEGGGQVIAFHAPSRQCEIHRNGMVQCTFDETTMLTLKGHEEASIVFRDHADHPVGTLRIVATPYYRCLPTDKYYTRSIKLDTLYSRRCPGMGQCTGNICAQTSPDTLIDEFRAVNDRPGWSRCHEACSGFGCGCLSFGSACFFSRTFVEPLADHIFAITECEWEQGLAVEWSMENHAPGKAILMAGETARASGIEIGAMTITADKSLLPKTFSTKSRKTRVLQASEIRAAQLFRCPTEENAKQLENCSLDGHDIACHQADDKIICESRGNDFLNDETRTLPQLIGGDLYQVKDGEIRVDAKGSSTLQVKVRGLLARTQIDVASCEIVESELKGCFACTSGATWQYVCHSDFGKQIGHLECGDVTAVLQCDGTHQRRATTLLFTAANVDYECKLKCTGGTTKVRINGHLVYVPSQGNEQWIRGSSIATERSTMEAIKEMAQNLLTEHLPLVLSVIAVLMLIPKLIKFVVRLII